jgi:hypothetical protein
MLFLIPVCPGDGAVGRWVVEFSCYSGCVLTDLQMLYWFHAGVAVPRVTVDAAVEQRTSPWIERHGLAQCRVASDRRLPQTGSAAPGASGAEAGAAVADLPHWWPLSSRSRRGDSGEPGSLWHSAGRAARLAPRWTTTSASGTPQTSRPVRRGDPVAQVQQGDQQPVSEHQPVPGAGSDRPLTRPIGQPRVLTRLPARSSSARTARDIPAPGDQRQRRHGPGSSTHDPAPSFTRKPSR